MTLAFFLVYPIILLLASATVLCHLIGRPVNKKVVDRWQMILQLGVFAPLVAGGMVTGIFAKGTADHFSSEHGVSVQLLQYPRETNIQCADCGPRYRVPDNCRRGNLLLPAADE